MKPRTFTAGHEAVFADNLPERINSPYDARAWIAAHPEWLAGVERVTEVTVYMRVACPSCQGSGTAGNGWPCYACVAKDLSDKLQPFSIVSFARTKLAQFRAQEKQQ